MAQRKRIRLPMQAAQVQSLGQENPLEKEMTTHFSALAWKIHGQRSLVGYTPRGSKESDTTERLHCIFLCVFYIFFNFSAMTIDFLHNEKFDI